MSVVSGPFDEVSALLVTVPLGTAVFGLLVLTLLRQRRFTPARALVAAALSVYAAGVIANTIFPIYLDKPQSGEPWTPHLTLIPFSGYEAADALTNIAVFIPLGLLIPLLLQAPTPPKVVALVACTSLAIEVTQLAVQRPFGGGHITDINDFIFNTIGGAIGYAAFVLLEHSASIRPVIDHLRWRPEAARRFRRLEERQQPR